jgi:RNase P/RNase MRP subunit POP5
VRCKVIIKEGNRRRYIGFQIFFKKNKDSLSKQDIISALKSKCKELYDVDIKAKRIFLVKFNEDTGIVRCKHTEKDATIKILYNIKKIKNDIDIEIKTLGTSGTIKSLEKKHMHK